LAQKLGQLLSFLKTYIFWANLTLFSLQAKQAARAIADAEKPEGERHPFNSDRFVRLTSGEEELVSLVCTMARAGDMNDDGIHNGGTVHMWFILWTDHAPNVKRSLGALMVTFFICESDPETVRMFDTGRPRTKRMISMLATPALIYLLLGIPEDEEGWVSDC
jgi:hypothetical protein